MLVSLFYTLLLLLCSTFSCASLVFIIILHQAWNLFQLSSFSTTNPIKLSIVNDVLRCFPSPFQLFPFPYPPRAMEQRMLGVVTITIAVPAAGVYLLPNHPLVLVCHLITGSFLSINFSPYWTRVP